METMNQTYFFTGTYAQEDEPGIYLCSIHQETGEMTLVQSFAGIENPSYLAVNRTGTVLYAVSEKEEGEISAFSIGPDHVLQPIGSRRTEGGAPCYASLTPGEEYILTVNYSGGNVNVFAAEANGAVGEMVSQVRHSGSGFREDRQEGPHPHSVLSGRQGERVYVCDLGLDQILIYRLENGRLVTHREIELPPGSGPRHLAVHPSGKWIYAVNELSNTVTVFANDEINGDLKMLQHLPTLPAQYAAGSDDTASEIKASPCGRFVYVSNRGHDSLALFHADPSTGLLEAADWQTAGGRTPRNFNLVGGLLVAANQNSGNLVSFRIDKETGRLIPTGYELEIPSPACVVPLPQQ